MLRVLRVLRSVKSVKSVKACRSFLGLLWGPPLGASSGGLLWGPPRGGFPGAAYNGKKKQEKILKKYGKTLEKICKKTG